jgi:hypothetical protein
MDISCVIRVLTKMYAFQGVEASEINNGLCEEFAGKVIDYMDGESQDLYDLATPYTDVYEDWPGHYWVYYKGKHYDAECPEGVENWEDLPIFQRYRQDGGGHPIESWCLRFNGR